MVGFFHLKDGRGKRGKPKGADYLLRYTRDFTVAVVEALLFRSRTTGSDQHATHHAEEAAKHHATEHRSK